MSIKQVRMCDFCGLEIISSAGPWFWFRIEPDGGNGKDLHVGCLVDWVNTVADNQPPLPTGTN